MRVPGSTPAGRCSPIDALLLQRSPRWLVDDADAQAPCRTARRAGARALAQRPLQLCFADGRAVPSTPLQPRGCGGLGAVFWLLAASRCCCTWSAMRGAAGAAPRRRNLLYALMALCQAGNLLFTGRRVDAGAWAARRLHAPGTCGLRIGVRPRAPARQLVHAASLHPRAPAGMRRAGSRWSGSRCGLRCAWRSRGWLATAWWWAQGGADRAAACSPSRCCAWLQRSEPHPLAAACGASARWPSRRWLLLTRRRWPRPHGCPAAQPACGDRLDDLVSCSSPRCCCCVPFLARTQQLMREFSLLAGVSTVADLARPVVRGRVLARPVRLAHAGAVHRAGRSMRARGNGCSTSCWAQACSPPSACSSASTASRARSRPPAARRRALLLRLLRELFEPLELGRATRTSAGARVVGDGSTLLVPVPRLPAADELQPRGSLRAALRAPRPAHVHARGRAPGRPRASSRWARRGLRPARSSRGAARSALRIAQDLHDDIGARLLTLMYKAPDAARWKTTCATR